MIPNEKGLTDNEVKINQQKYGLNILPEKLPPSSFSLIIEQLKSPLVYVLLFACAVTIAIGHYPDALIIFVAVLINTILGFIQESKASNALFALKHYLVSQVTVIRNGGRVSIETAQVVPGDIVVLSQGTKIPGDGVLMSANRLYIDEAILTGESISVGKRRGDQVFMGTTIASGQAIMKVEKIGRSTKMGVIALQIQEREADTPLQKQLKGFSRQLVLAIHLLLVLVFVAGILNKFSLVEMFTVSVALAVSSIPEGLIVSLTAVLAIGMQKILKRKGLVKKLSAAETLGGVTVICVDKTGTLTQGKMEVVDIIGDKVELAEQVLLANDLDDPIVISAFEWGRTVLTDFVEEHQRLDSIPFSSKERLFTSLHRWSDYHNRLYVNGAPELLLGWTSLSEKKKLEVLSTIDELTKQGKRLIGFARKDVANNKKSLDITDAKNGLTWVGIIAFSDSVRSGVKQALNEALSAGIRTVVITGDYTKTSQFVLSELGISLSETEIITGDKLAKLSESELVKIVKDIKLFARTSPDQKLAIVKALKQRGEVVAMMGDGVNDAPALHQADIGIAVGEATDVAKESADLVLLDSNFSTIVAAIEEGRIMFGNIRKIILYLMCDAFVEIFVVVISILIGLPLPITAMQILWINLISDGLPNLALTIDPKDVNIMKEKPRNPKEKLVNKWMISLIGFVSLVAGIVTLASFTFVYKTSNSLIMAQSVAFLTLGLNSLAYVFSVRALLVPFWKNHMFENKWLVLAVASGFGLQMLPFATPTTRQFFGIANLGPVYWFVAIGLSILLFFVVEIFKYLYVHGMPINTNKVRTSG